ncbi:MAG: DUF1203 domain-containing protein [Ramlibacter sp.]
MPSFRLVGLDPAPFEPLFALDDAQLRARGAVRVRADSMPGYPCRISLEDAPPGDELLLLPFEHQPCDSPYRSAGPIFVRRGARQATLPCEVLPPYVTRRLIALRAYDAGGMMVDAGVAEGESALRGELERLLADGRVRYLHLHNARRGCFSCRVERVE